MHADAAGVVSAGTGGLQRIAGADPRVVAHLAAVKALLDRCLWLRSKGRAATHPSVEEYLQSQLGHERTEQVRVIFVDTRCRVMSDETMWRGTFDRAPLYVREIISRALEIGAAGLVVVHNHPSGDPQPSDGDVRATRNLVRACATMDLKLHDHLILAAGDRFSMRRAGLLT